MPAITTPLIRILLVEDYLVIRVALRLLLDSYPNLCVTGEAGSPRDSIDLAAREQPDIILFDLNLPGVTGLEIIPDLLASAPHCQIIILTAVDDAEVHKQAVRLGARGLVHKEKTPEVLIKAINKVFEGELWFDRALLGSVVAAMSKLKPSNKQMPLNQVSTLSVREREVVALVGEGLKNRQIAERLFIAEGTVRHHLTSIFAKLGVADRFELMIYAFRNGIAKPPQ